MGKVILCLLLTVAEYSDSGQYRCVLTKEGQEVVLGEFDLEVKGSEAAFVQWKRWTQVVLQWKSDSLFVDPVFEGGVSVPKERIGDISLIFNDTLPDDEGYYVCFFKKNDGIRPSTIVNLTITVPEQRTGKHMEKESEKGSEMLPLQSIEIITHEDSISLSKSAVI
ncbi:hypothetical protein G5714_016915 [Onychostoma macrolepis]|uniref:Ig-like domain-containing protein n=1 Tax=Onychostoma macrolepis TaxID=369639 RepID=A0A7J6C673_9TELE|nr:hypothetical protein G5714_016915 [Onychostoma macrolepis]